MATQNTNIIIIGPVGAGKSTQGKLIANALNKQLVSLDRIADDYYMASGYSASEFQRAKDEKGFLVAYRLWWPSLAYAAQQVVKDYTDCVIDFGAGHSHYEDDLLHKRVKEALAGCRHKILLLPTEDLDRSVFLLRQRCIEQRKTDWIHDGYDFIEHWVKDDCNHDLATVTVFTDGKTPEQTSQEIINRLDLVKSKGPMKWPQESEVLYCSFCGKSQHEVRKLIAGPEVFICDECTDVCIGVILAEKAPGELGMPNLDSLIRKALGKESES